MTINQLSVGTVAILLNLLAHSPPVIAHGEDDPLLYSLNIDQLEQRWGDETLAVLEADAWVGYDLHKIKVKTDIEYQNQAHLSQEWQFLYSRGLSPYWNLDLAIRHDNQPKPERNWAVIGVQGVAPYFIDVDSTLFFDKSGRSAWRLQLEYEWLLRQRWALIPKFTLNVFSYTDNATGSGSGVTDTEIGLRLAYELRRELVPYIGINWENKWGKTADFAKDEGEQTRTTQLVIGIHAWL